MRIIFVTDKTLSKLKYNKIINNNQKKILYLVFKRNKTRIKFKIFL